MSSPKSSDSSRKYNEPCTIEETKDEPEDKGMESEGAGPRVKGEVKNSMAQMGQFDEYMMKSMREFQKYTSNGMEFKSYRSGPYSADRGPRSAQSSPIISNVLRSSPIAAASMKRTYTSKSPSNPIETFFSKLSSSHGKSEEISSPAEQSGDVDKQTTTSPRETHPDLTGSAQVQDSRAGWSLGSGFRAFKDVIANKVKFSEEGEEESDWDFWGKVVNESPDSLKTYRRRIRKKIYEGIPSSLRGIIWQTLAGSNDPELESMYKSLLLKKSRHSDIIERDTTRTFPEQKHFAGLEREGQQSLFNLINAYSVYDPEIGYCQGIAFLGGILLFNISEEGAFCTLVKLMKNYNLRELYSPTMSGLSAKMYQFDCISRDLFPKLMQHFEDIGVESSMYVSQWFPLNIVFLIMDVLFIDGLDSIIIFSLGIISRSTDTMMNTDLETLLEFLKGDIIKPYVDDLTLLIKDYMTFYPHIHRLNKYAKEHQKKPTYMHSGGDVVNDMQVELNITKSALESIKKDLCSVNTDYMDLSKKYETVCNELERANYRAKAAEKKLNTVLDSICSSDNSHVEVGEDMMYAELLIKKNIDIASENLHLKEKLDILTKKIDSITSESNLKRNDN